METSSGKSARTCRCDRSFQKRSPNRAREFTPARVNCERERSFHRHSAPSHPAPLA